MASLNRCEFIGNCGGDPEVRYTQNGTAVGSFKLAVNDSWTKDGQKQERTEWIPCTVWGKQAELAREYIHKGKQLYIEGRWQTDSWDDKETGKRVYMTKCVVNRFQLLGRREDSSYAPKPAQDEYNIGDLGPPLADSIDPPFYSEPERDEAGF